MSSENGTTEKRFKGYYADNLSLKIALTAIISFKLLVF